MFICVPKACTVIESPSSWTWPRLLQITKKLRLHGLWQFRIYGYVYSM